MAIQSFSTVVVTPGTPQRLTSNTTPAQAQISGGLAGSVPPNGTSIVFTAEAGNTAAKKIYIGGPTMNVAAKTGIAFELLPGANLPAIYTSGPTSLQDLWIDTDSVAASTEKLLVSIA